MKVGSVKILAKDWSDKNESARVSYTWTGGTQHNLSITSSSHRCTFSPKNIVTLIARKIAHYT